MASDVETIWVHDGTIWEEIKVAEQMLDEFECRCRGNSIVS